MSARKRWGNEEASDRASAPKALLKNPTAFSRIYY